MAELQNTIGFQCFSDGGFAEGVGATGVVLYRVRSAGQQVELVELGAIEQLLRGATSAFCTEVAELHLLTEVLFDVARRLRFSSIL